MVSRFDVTTFALQKLWQLKEIEEWSKDYIFRTDVSIPMYMMCRTQLASAKQFEDVFFRRCNGLVSVFSDDVMVWECVFIRHAAEYVV